MDPASVHRSPLFDRVGREAQPTPLGIYNDQTVTHRRVNSRSRMLRAPFTSRSISTSHCGSTHRKVLACPTVSFSVPHNPQVRMVYASSTSNTCFVPKRAARQLDEVQVNQSGQQNHVILRNVLEAYGE